MKFLDIINKCEAAIKKFDDNVLVAAEVKMFGEPLDDKLDRLYDKTGELIAIKSRQAKEWYATRKETR